MLGARGRKDEKLDYKTALWYIAVGLSVFFASYFLSWLFINLEVFIIAYIMVTSLGYLFILRGGTLLTRVIKNRLRNDVFNDDNEIFPQMENRITNEYSVNLPAVYNLKGKKRNSWINIINPFRSWLVLGSPGSGKSFFVIQHVIRQHIEKGFSMFIYDFKFDDLSLIAYNHLQSHKNKYKIEPSFYVINFDNLPRSHRCNPLDKENMLDITDAAESARTILLGLNREWIKRQGDFFVESAINSLTAVIWFLRRYQDDEFCTLPQVIELMQAGYATSL